MISLAKHLYAQNDWYISTGLSPISPSIIFCDVEIGNKNYDISLHQEFWYGIKKSYLKL